MLPTPPAPLADATDRSSRRARVGLVVLALALAATYFATEIYLLSGAVGFPLDDSWIHLQFARNLAAGDGLSYNPGQRVTGSTAPLWTALLTPFFLGADPDAFRGADPTVTTALGVGVQLLGILLYTLSVLATFGLARELGLSRGFATLAGAWTAATSWLVWSAVSGMEIPLFVVLSVGGITLHLRERRNPRRTPLSLGVFGLSVLARPEGLALLGLALVDRLVVHFDTPGDDQGLVWRRPERSTLRAIAIGLGIAALALVGPALAYFMIGGSFFPTTMTAKGGEFRRLLPDLGYLGTVLGIFFRSQPWLTLAAAGGVLALVERLGEKRDRGLLPALWLIGLPLAYATITPIGRGQLAGNFGRYYFPLLPILVVLGVLGLERAARVLGPRLRLRAAGGGLPLRALVLGLLLWPTAADFVRGSLRYGQNLQNVIDSDVALARWLAPRLPADAVLAVNDIGAIKFLLPNQVIDLVGISSPEVRREVNSAMQSGVTWDEAMFEAIETRQPDYLAIFPAWFPALANDSRFQLLAMLEIPNNITMGDDRIGLWSTPWTRRPLARLPNDPDQKPEFSPSPVLPPR